MQTSQVRHIDPVVRQMALWFNGIWIATWFVKLMSQTHIFQLRKPELINIGIDNTFWLIHLTGIPQFLSSHPPAAFVLEFVLLLLPLLLFTRFRTKAALLFCILFVIVGITQQSYSSTPMKSGIAPLLVMLPFLFKGDNLNLVKEGVRFYVIMVFVSAACFKFINGGLLELDQFTNILINQHQDLQVFQPLHSSIRIKNYIMEHPGIGTTLYIFAFLLQLSFIIGLATRKLDYILLLFLVTFCFLTFLFMRIYNFDLLFFGAAMLPLSSGWREWFKMPVAGDEISS